MRNMKSLADVKLYSATPATATSRATMALEVAGWLTSEEVEDVVEDVLAEQYEEGEVVTVIVGQFPHGWSRATYVA